MGNRAIEPGSMQVIASASCSVRPLHDCGVGNYNPGVKAHLETPPQRIFGLPPVVFGTLCGMLAAVGYTAANICLRSVVKIDPYWVSCVKSFPTVALVGPWLLVRMSRRQRVLPPLRPLLILLAAAAFGQLAGNVSFQYALGVIGIALTVPLVLGTLILAGALLGWILLGEHITRRTAIATLLLIVAVCVLSIGAPAAHRATAPADANGMLTVGVGVAAACLAGFAYALLGVAIRHGVTGEAPISTTLLVVGVAGVVLLGGCSWSRIGWSGVLATGELEMAYMLLAGICNAVAFFALTKALQLASVVYVNALNATQTAMAAVAGVMIFAEPLSAALGLGIVLTAAGLVLMKGGETSPRRLKHTLVHEQSSVGAEQQSPKERRPEYSNP